MATTTITALTAGTALAGTEVSPFDQSGATVKITSAQLKTWTSDSPTLVTPNLGVATATSINKVAITAPASSATLTIADGKTLTSSNTLTLVGTDSTTMTFPTTSATIARTDAGQTFTGTQTFSSAPVFSSQTVGRVMFAGASGVLTDSSNFAWDDSNQRLNIGGGASTAGYDIFVSKSTNGEVGIRVKNASTGTAAIAALYSFNSANFVCLQKSSTGYTTNGLLTADIALTYNSTSGSVYVNQASSPHIFAVGGFAAANEIVRFDSTTGVTIKSGVKLQLGNAATTGLSAGVLAASTNASIVITDSTGQAYRIPCII